MKQLLKFKQLNLTRKTSVYEVYSNHSKELLGTIHWRNGWRCYVISYEKDIDMSIGCNKELNKFMEQLEKERKFAISMLPEEEKQ